MRNKKLFVSFIALIITATITAQVGIGTSNPDQSSILHVSEGNTNKKGFLPPRLTENSMNAMTNVAGMMVYCTNCTPKCIYVNDGSEFKSLCGAPSQLSINSASTLVEGLYVNGNAFTTDNKLKITINNDGAAAKNLNLQTTDLVLSGSAAANISVSNVSPATISIAANSSEIIEFTLSGTPSSTGQISAVFSNAGLSHTATITISDGDANFTSTNGFVVSIYDAGPPIVDIQGKIGNVANALSFDLNYTDGVGSYAAYTSPWVTVTGENGDVNAIRMTYPAGTFSGTGAITATIQVQSGGDGSFHVEKQAPGVVDLISAFDVNINGNVKAIANVNAVGGILNTNFMALQNGASYAISGANSASDEAVANEYGPTKYNNKFGSSTDSWRAGGAFYYDDGTSKTRPNKNASAGAASNVATTWPNTGSNLNGSAYMVVDFGEQRVINTIFAHQTNSDGRFTSVEVSVANSALPGNDPGWRVVKPFVANEVGCNYSATGYQLDFPITVTRYIRYRFKNEGTCGSNSYIEVYGIGTFLHF